MPRQAGQVPPRYSLHKASGQAVVRIDEHDRYLGPYGSPDSHDEYERLISEWRVSKQAASGNHQSFADGRLTVNEVLLRYFKFAQAHYVDGSGEITKEYTEMTHALRPVRRLYGRSSIRDFGPLALKAIRLSMIERGNLSRGVTNRRVNRIRRFLKWAVSEELAPPSVHEAIRTVSGLRRGELGARETMPVKPVPQAFVDAVVAAAHPQVAAMIQVQRLGGMRPGEVVVMRACDIDMSGDIWIYEPYDHKNRWRGKERAPILLGPQAQEILRPFLQLDTTAFLFSPREAERQRNIQRRVGRKTPLTPSQRKRRPKRSPKRPKRDCYDADSYRRAITYTITKINRERTKRCDAEIPSWCPLQLRHSRATEIRKQFGIEAAQVFLGHEHADITQVYAERDLQMALRVARQLG